MIFRPASAKFRCPALPLDNSPTALSGVAMRFAVPRGRAPRILAAALAALAACGEPRRPAPAGESAGPAYGGTLVIAGANDLETLNPLAASEKWGQEFIRFALFLPLIRYGPRLEYEPALAESWELLGDTGVVFRLRRDVRWHDGRPVTAEDVAFTFERAKDPRTAFPNAHYFAAWRAAEVLDSFTIRFRFDPHPDPLAGWPFTPPVPRHLLAAVPPERMRMAEFGRRPVGNGPFRFVSVRPNDRWVFEANPDFPTALGGRPYVDRVVWRVVPENAAQVAELLTGNVDVIVAPGADRLRTLDADPEIRAVVRPSRTYLFIGWNGRRPPFHDARVRRALTMAIDRARLVARGRAGYGEVAAGPISPHHWAYDPSITPLPYDTAAAARLLEEAGFRDRDGDGVREDARGRKLEFRMKIAAENAFQRDLAELIRADLAAVGVRLRPEPTEFTTLVAQISSPARDFDAVLMGWESDFRINLTPLFHSSARNGPYQLASYSNPEVDRLLDLAERTTDRAAAAPLWRRIQLLLRDDQPWTFLYHSPELFAVRERVRGVHMDIRGALVELPRWWLVPASAAAASPGARPAPPARRVQPATATAGRTK